MKGSFSWAVLMTGLLWSWASGSQTLPLDINHHGHEAIGGLKDTQVVVYGDMRFTDPSEKEATVVGARRALVSAIADDAPSAVFLTGDVPWHGGNLKDYEVFAQETQAFKQASIQVWPVLGNHEFMQCAEAQCLANWWQSFPALQGTRWYSVEVGQSLTAIALDSNASLLDGSAQRLWLEETLNHLRASDRYVLILLHHPPVADIEDGPLASHNPRDNERALAAFLAKAAVSIPNVRWLVVAGHIHNYEHLERNGLVYLVSGGGGAKAYPVKRGTDDLYPSHNEINFHYLRLTVRSARLIVEMRRLKDPYAFSPHEWEVADRIELTPASQNP